MILDLKISRNAFKLGSTSLLSHHDTLRRARTITKVVHYLQEKNANICKKFVNIFYKGTCFVTFKPI
jgi:hypothetical protein